MEIEASINGIDLPLIKNHTNQKLETTTDFNEAYNEIADRIIHN